jgi:glutaredoxin-related protein
VPEAEVTELLHERMQTLMTRERVMLFIEGDPAAPRGGAGRLALATLEATKLPFGVINVLADESIRLGTLTDARMDCND